MHIKFYQPLWLRTDIDMCVIWQYSSISVLVYVYISLYILKIVYVSYISVLIFHVMSVVLTICVCQIKFHINEYINIKINNEYILYILYILFINLIDTSFYIFNRAELRVIAAMPGLKRMEKLSVNPQLRA
jgi:hypothetical protein